MGIGFRAVELPCGKRELARSASILLSRVRREVGLLTAGRILKRGDRRDAAKNEGSEMRAMDCSGIPRSGPSCRNMGGLLTNGLNQIEGRKKEKKKVNQANGLGWDGCGVA